METSAMKAWRERLASGTFTKSQVQQWCNAVVPRASGYTIGGRATNLTAEEAGELLDLFPAAGVAITDEHAEQGMDWAARNGKRLGLPASYVAACREHRVTYRFLGAAEIDANRWRMQTVPKYAACYSDGDGRDRELVYTYHGGNWRGGGTEGASVEWADWPAEHKAGAA